VTEVEEIWLQLELEADRRHLARVREQREELEGEDFRPDLWEIAEGRWLEKRVNQREVWLTARRGEHLH
jgi:hypothetical protein